MERTEEALRERVRETPLSERLKTCEKYIASMCAERRPPKMTIPLQHYDEDFYIYTTLADAQATIAALQARVRELEEITKVICGHCCEPMEIPSKAVLQSALTQRTAELEAARVDNRTYINERHDNMKQIEQLQARVRELEQWVQDQSAANLEKMRHTDEMQSRAMEAESQLTQRTAEVKDLKEWLSAYKQSLELAQSSLTQRTAELEAAKAERSKALESQQNMLQSMANWLAQLKPTHHPSYRKGVEEVIAAAFNGYRADKGQPVLLSEWQEQQIRLATLQAELERVRGELQSAEAGYFVAERDLQGMNNRYDDLRTLIAALPKVEVVTGDTVVNIVQQYNFHQWMLRALQHRQGMEG